jgi:hypothetical protein
MLLEDNQVTVSEGCGFQGLSCQVLSQARVQTRTLWLSQEAGRSCML